MKFVDEVSPEKLRGGFYTPPQLVAECFGRVAELLGNDRALDILEPSAGDGAFVRGVSPAVRGALIRKPRFTCVEILHEEAAKCRDALRSAHLKGEVIDGSFFSWARGQLPSFDALVGNPPFVRYQFVPRSQRDDANWIFGGRGQVLDGVANLWIPFLLISLELLRSQGAFAMVLPSELFATKSAGVVRSELIRHIDDLQIDLHPRGSFPRILQDTIVLSGRRCEVTGTERVVKFVEHSRDGKRMWKHRITDAKDCWTRYLLCERELNAYDAACELEEIHRLGEVASISVSIVTGANDFFTVDNATVAEFELERWAKPLLSKTNDSPGLVFTPSDLSRARKSGRKVWILDFSADLPDPMAFEKPRKYIRSGEKQELQNRYKCGIREPWYRVPDVRYDCLMMSKRAHQFHRLILNRAKVHTTDTIYRGKMRPMFGQWKESLVAAFHNSLTILSSEMEGRTYGGGVLEMVPSEIARLVVPLIDMQADLPDLDKLCRKSGGQLDADGTLIQATNTLLCEHVPEICPLIEDLESARTQLRQRRFFG